MEKRDVYYLEKIRETLWVDSFYVNVGVIFFSNSLELYAHVKGMR